ncbi:hypothetical protein ABZW11_17770 [Nonomuraea sp. NPDC004580]|uniref:hypothetical protein n=1 Tax=Nonomuraea sp. NPDC004580 TaxID=3154552 RepID=UPI0033BB74D2
MRSTRASLVAGGTALAALLSAAQPAARPAVAAPVGTGCLAYGQAGSYLSREGGLKLTLSPGFLAELRRAGIGFSGLGPVELVDGGKALWTPVGERYDTVATPSGRICHPGGFALSDPETNVTYAIDTFRMVFAATGGSALLATPAVNGRPRPRGELTLAGFSLHEALAPGTFVRHGGGVGPRKVALTLHQSWADDLNRELGTRLRGGAHWADLAIAWQGTPSRPVPAGTSPGLRGIELVNAAIRRTP